MFFDTHCHLTLTNIDKKDINDIIKNAQSKGVTSILDISVGDSDFFKRSEIINALCREYLVTIYMTVGIPPFFSDKRVKNDISLVKEQSEKEKKVIGIGEIGLDYYHHYGDKKRQIGLFVEQIEIANELNLPVIVHTRESDDDLINTLKQCRPVKGGIIHCFSSGIKTAKKLLDMGFYISFAGNVTYKKSAQIRDVVSLVPEDQYLIETDSPYLSPEGFRGKPNEPAHVAVVASFIAKLRGISVEKIARQTTQNARRALGI